MAIAAIKSEDTIAELSSKFEIHRAQIMRGKKEALTALPDVFSVAKDRKKKDQEKLVEELYRQIGANPGRRWPKRPSPPDRTARTGQVSRSSISN